MSNVVEKAKSTGNNDIMVCERGFSFGYNNLVSDMRSLVIMRETGCPVVFDATHSTQLPGLNKDSSSGQSQFIEHLAKAAIAVGDIWNIYGNTSKSKRSIMRWNEFIAIGFIRKTFNQH